MNVYLQYQLTKRAESKGYSNLSGEDAVAICDPVYEALNLDANAYNRCYAAALSTSRSKAKKYAQYLIDGGKDSFEKWNENSGWDLGNIGDTLSGLFQTGMGYLQSQQQSGTTGSGGYSTNPPPPPPKNNTPMIIGITAGVIAIGVISYFAFKKK
jgi:hypothetical protein